MPNTPAVHYLRPAKQTRTPARLYVLDTETKPVQEGEREVYALRLWCSAFIDRQANGARTHAWRWSDGMTARGLAQSIDRAARKHGSLWVYAHNLAFDLATTRLPEHLVGRRRGAARTVRRAVRGGAGALRAASLLQTVDRHRAGGAGHRRDGARAALRGQGLARDRGRE